MPSNNPATAPRDWLVLALILAGALALRIVGLNDPLWYDEIITLDTHLHLPWGRMMEVYSMNHHYLYSFETKALMPLLGEAPWVLRLPALAFGMASIAAAWWLARELAGATVAHVAAALLALSFHHIWFSQNARGYTELTFFAIVGMALFLRATGARPTLPSPSGEGLRSALFFALVLGLAIFTHLTGAFFFFALGQVWAFLVAARRFPPGLVRWGLIGFGLGGVLTLIAYAPVIPSLTHTVSGVGETTANSAVPEYGNPLWTIAEALRTAISDSGPLMLVAALAVVTLCAIGALRSPRPAALLGAIVLVHIVSTMALLWLIGMRIWPRFFLLDIGFLMILLTLGVREACRIVAARFGPRAETALFVLGVSGMLGVSLVLALRNYESPKQDLEGAIVAAEGLRRPGERVYAVGYAGDVLIGHYHARWGRIMTPADFARELAIAGPVTLVIGFPDRTFATIPEMQRDRDTGRLKQVRRLPGTLGDGAVVILQR